MSAAIDTTPIDLAWDNEASGVRARPQRKPPLPLPVVVRRYLEARLEAEARMDAGDRVRVELGGEVFDVVMVADRLNAAGEFVARGGLRVEKPRR